MQLEERVGREKFSAAALEACTESLAAVDDGVIVYANPAFARLFRYRHADEVMGRPLTEFIPVGHLCTQRRASRQGELSDCGYTSCAFDGRRSDGTEVRMEASCSPFSADDRQFLMIAARDISNHERRRVERESDRRFRTIVNAAAIGIGHCTLEGQIVESNPALQRLLGYTGEELKGMHFREFTDDSDFAADRKLFEELILGKRESYQLEKRYVRKDRSTIWGRLTLSLVRGPSGDPEFAIGMVEDITERKHAEQQLFEAQKMEAIGRLVGGVAHDFNNLLTGILLYCDLLLAGIDPGSRLKKHADEIHLAAEQGAALIQQLLAVARKQVVEPKVLSLNDVVSGMKNLLERLIGENIELTADLAEDLGRVRVDPAQAQQLILNLVLNARDAMPDGGRIVVTTCNRDVPGQPVGLQGVSLAVKDTGCGMDAATRARLFEPFFTTKSPGRGNGLGLSTVQSIVKHAGGWIGIESEPGRGTEVTLVLPLVEEAAPAAVKPQVTATSGSETVLLVEDDLSIRQSANRVLSDCGYEVLEATNGAEALKICERFPARIDLLLCDQVMPGMSGREVAQRVRALRPDVQVIYMSGFQPDTSDEREPVVVFRKPFTGSALTHKVREVLNQSSVPGATGKKG